MMQPLTIEFGQCSSAGIKPVNQDYADACVPTASTLLQKGAIFALSDGVGSSLVSQVASEFAVTAFIKNYYQTSIGWSVSYAAQCVLKTMNAQLYTKNQQGPYQYNLEKGYVCTFSALLLEGQHGHIFHIGDSRIYRVRNNTLEQLTTDHCQLDNGEKLLSRAMGISAHDPCDYVLESLCVDDVFVLLSDGVFDFVDDETLLAIANQKNVDLNVIANELIEQAQPTSNDNLTAQVVKVSAVAAHAKLTNTTHLPIPSVLKVGDSLDGLIISRVIYASSRSHVYLALDENTQKHVVIKAPSIEFKDNKDQLDRLLLEEWIANKCTNPHLIKAVTVEHARSCCYSVFEYIAGKTLTQWLIDNPQPELEVVRTIIEQAAKGLGALHRSDILHQDIRPENIMITEEGIVKIIDFGSARLPGFADDDSIRLGTALFSAPEYFIGAGGSEQSDLYSLAVLSYFMLCGRYPYGVKVAKVNNIAAQNKLVYQSVVDPKKDIPLWLDATLKKALHTNPLRRYQHLSEFIYDLRHPNKSLIGNRSIPWVEQNPLLFWRTLSLILALLLLVSWVFLLFRF
jgi:protein phosphatase